jgi:RAB protein geranylgeranyltransferase component A
MTTGRINQVTIVIIYMKFIHNVEYTIYCKLAEIHKYILFDTTIKYYMSRRNILHWINITCFTTMNKINLLIVNKRTSMYLIFVVTDYIYNKTHINFIDN